MSREMNCVGWSAGKVEGKPLPDRDDLAEVRPDVRTKSFWPSKDGSRGALSRARSGERRLRLPPVTPAAAADGKTGIPRRVTVGAYSGAAYQRTSWPRRARCTAVPVNGLKCPSAGSDAKRIRKIGQLRPVESKPKMVCPSAGRTPAAAKAG